VLVGEEENRRKEKEKSVGKVQAILRVWQNGNERKKKSL